MVDQMLKSTEITDEIVIVSFNCQYLVNGDSANINIAIV